LTCPQQRCDSRAAERQLALDQHTQRLLHAGLALPRRQVQDLQVLPVGMRRQCLVEEVIGHAEAAAGEQRLPVAVVGQRPRLAHQGVNHVSIVDLLLAPPPQPRQRLDQLLAIPHFQRLQVQPHFDALAD
jgi:hypothetical protein